MDNLAPNYQNILPTSVEGLDEVFAVREQDASRTRTGSLVREQGANQLSVEEAAKLLGVSARAIQKRLKKGTLQGRKEKTAQGERWLLDANELVREQDANQLSDCSLVREPGANQLPDSEVISICADVAEDQAHGPAPVDPELLKELLAKLEVLTYRNGYLEAQLTERQKEVDSQREQIKLLTDSQHKPSWWRRFTTWFMGRG